MEGLFATQAKQVLDDVVERLPPLYDLEEIRMRVEEFTALCHGGYTGVQLFAANGRGFTASNTALRHNALHVLLQDVGELMAKRYCMPQEAERMNVLLDKMKHTLYELNLGLKGDLTMSEAMEELMQSFANDVVPHLWANVAYPSLRPLSSWFANLLQRVQQITE